MLHSPPNPSILGDFENCSPSLERRANVEKPKCLKQSLVLCSDMGYSNIGEIEAVIFAFEECALPRSQWTHSAHLAVALWYLTRHPKAVATQLIREGIQRYNVAMGIPQAKESGYHETITLFWIEIVARFLMEQSDNSSMLSQIHTLLQRHDDPDLMFQYYSCDRLMSWEARTNWLEPDLKPLPA
jgi:hypothetical protein